MKIKEDKNTIRHFIIRAIMGIFIVGFLLFVSEKMGGFGEFPEGCWEKYPENMTPSGTVYSDKDSCYGKVYTGWDSEATFLFSKGRNTYKNIQWERVKD